ncbi:hypothetical protein BWI17_01510 [Betaproteobacteria bacterium GR16-43]|nr:hypothetical protein BWI17_01510 [Betaproteobacteria bacterium GR16-43]
MAADDELLRSQVAQTWRKELRQLEWLGVADGQSILELGCGPGWITERLLEAYPNSAITALDNHAERLAQGRARLHPVAPERLQWREARAESSGLASESFDLVYARFLFHYVEDPLVLAREALRVLKPGGMLVVTEIDDGLFGVTSPEVPELASVLERVARARQGKGGDRHRGRELRGLLAKAGFDAIDLDAIAFDTTDMGHAASLPQLGPAHLRRLAQAGVLRDDEEARWTAAGERFLADPDAYVLRLFLVCRGRKPQRA